MQVCSEGAVKLKPLFHAEKPDEMFQQSFYVSRRLAHVLTAPTSSHEKENPHHLWESADDILM